jgi:hypothetical protein
VGPSRGVGLGFIGKRRGDGDMSEASKQNKAGERNCLGIMACRPAAAACAGADYCCID